MELNQCKVKVRCELGVCRNFADYTIKTKRAGLRNSINLCEDCLNELYALIGAKVVPKSVRSVFQKGEGAEDATKKKNRKSD